MLVVLRRQRRRMLAGVTMLTMTQVQRDNPDWTWSVTSDGALWQCGRFSFIAHTGFEAQEKISARVCASAGTRSPRNRPLRS